MTARPSSVSALCDWFVEDTRQRRQSRHWRNVACAIKPLRARYGDIRPECIGADELFSVRNDLIERGMLRTEIKRYMRIIRQMYERAAKVPRRWVTAEQLTELTLLDELQPGDYGTSEPKDVMPVPARIVALTLRSIRRAMHIGCQRDRQRMFELNTMIRVHWRTGMRPGELVAMRRRDLFVVPALSHKGRELWVYRPGGHKTAHHGHARDVFIGPRSQAMIEQWLHRPQAGDDRIWSIETTSGYRQAVQRICEADGIPRWFPNQIRHAFAVASRRRNNRIEIVQAQLGHHRITTTERYAPMDPLEAQADALRHG